MEENETEAGSHHRLVHTPGPSEIAIWAAHMPSAGQPSTIGQSGDLGMAADDVCSIMPIGWDDKQAAKATEWANARLIAAAPELLECLRDFIKTVQAVDPGVYCDAIDEAEAVIAKATGKLVE